MKAEVIEAVLAERYKGRGWACFFQFMPMTSFESVLNKIDLVAVGLWHKHDKIIAFEIKVKRSDFLKDLKDFKKKHRFALRISDEFYYVCPWGLIDKKEVPEDAGLMYVNKGNMIKIVKPALVRIIQSIPFQLFQGFAREFGNTVNHTKIPVKYLGKDMTQDDLMALVEKKREWDFESNVEKKAKEMAEEKEEKKGGRDLFVNKVKSMCSFYDMTEEEGFAQVLKHIELGMEFSHDYGFTGNLERMRTDVNTMLSLIDKKKKEKK